MVDAADLKSATSWRCVGSNPSLGTKIPFIRDYEFKLSRKPGWIARWPAPMWDNCGTNLHEPTLLDRSVQYRTRRVPRST